MSITIESLKKTYVLGQEKLDILKDLSAEIKSGEIVAIVGSSGSGKSTLLSLISGLDLPDAGQVKIRGQNIFALNKKEMISFRAHNIGIVFQQFHLVSHLTAFENVSLPLEILERPFQRKEIIAALENVGLAGRADHKPSELSGGESQRLALARALITKPQLLLADEPSGNLDTETGQKVMKVFFDQVRSHKTTTLLVTHDMKLADQCDRKLYLRDGQLWSTPAHA